MMRRAALLLGLLATPAAAWADPFTLVSFGVSALATAGTIPALTAFAINVGIAVLGAAHQRRKARKAAAAQRAAYNASLQDRTVTVLRGDPPWQVVYGRCIVGGAIVDIVTTDKANARREDGSTYTKADAYKHLVIVLAAHEVQAINEVYIDGTAVGTLDGSGYPTGGEFFKAGVTDTRRVVFTTTTTPAEQPVAVLQAYSVSGTGQDETYTTETVTIDGADLDGPVGVEVVCDYTVAGGGAVVRIGKHLGGAGQAVDSYLNSIAPSRYTTAHKLEGLAYIVVTLDLEDPRFQGGPPNITADVSGRKVLDPRTSTTAWSDNPALCIRDFLTAEWGYGADATEVDDDYVIAAANACDEEIDLDVGGSVTADQPRYTCNGAFTTDGAAEATLEDLAGCMAGTVAYGGSWQVLAGTWVAPVLDLGDDSLAGMPEVVQADTPVDDLVNGVRGQFVARGAQTPSDFNPYSNATFVADDGRELWGNVNLPFTDNLARARNLCRTRVEASRSGQVLRYPATLVAWPLQVGDRVRVTNAEYGLSLKAYRVTDWQFELTSPVWLTLEEDVESIYDTADAADADPTPNTELPNPWAVAAMAGVAALSDGTTLLRLADGSILPRVQVSWTARTDAYVLEGGRIEVLWRRQGQTAWQQQALPGAEVRAWIAGVDEGDRLLIEVRAVNSLGARSASTFVAHTVVGKSAAPSNVSGLAWGIKPGQVQIYWNRCTDVDYRATELRVGASWAAGTLLWAGAGTEYQHPRPANGTYTVWAAHQDTTGNYSATPSSVSVTVDDTIDASGTPLLLMAYDGQAYIFDNPAATSSSSPTITFTAVLYNATGTATWVATAYNAAGASLGTVTMGGSGNTRTLTAAQFNANGATTTRYVVVVASLGSLSDTVTVYRGDGGSDTLVVALSNEAHTMPADNSGTVLSYTGSGTTIRVFQGLTELDYDGVGTASGKWTVSSSASNITRGSLTDSGLYLTVGQHSSMTADQASITYTVSGKNSYGVAFSFDRVQSFAKSKQGSTGSTGSTGATGATGSSARRAYALFTGNPASVAWDAGATLTVSGDTLPGGTTVSSPDSATSWTSTTQTPSSGQSMWQADGLYTPSTNQTVWNSPYLSNLKVGNLAALSTDVDGTQSISVPDPGTSSPNQSRTTALRANSSAAADVGVYAINSHSTSPAVYAVNNSGGSTAPAMYGYGSVGVYGYAAASAGMGVKGQSNSGSGSAGVYGVGGSNGDGIVADWTGFSGSGVALRVKYLSVFEAQLSSTVSTGTAPFSVSSTTKVSNLNADLLDGKDWATPDPLGATTPSTVRCTSLRVDQTPNSTTGGGAPTFASNLPTGSGASTVVWGQINWNGTLYWVPLWPV